MRLLERQARRLPRRQAAVQDRATLVPHPAEQPPQARGDGAAALVVRDDRVLAADAPSAERRGELLAVWQRMPPLAYARMSREVVVEIRIARA